MQIILDEKGYVRAYATIGGFGTPSVTVSEPDNLDDFEMNYRSYHLSNNGKLVKSDDKQKEIEDQRVVTDLRKQREKICFPYINRGALWYEFLTDEQKEELKVWYQQWLEVTDTRVVPDTPTWLLFS